jgi:hypothetical protein
MCIRCIPLSDPFLFSRAPARACVYTLGLAQRYATYAENLQVIVEKELMVAYLWLKVCERYAQRMQKDGLSLRLEIF